MGTTEPEGERCGLCRRGLEHDEGPFRSAIKRRVRCTHVGAILAGKPKCAKSAIAKKARSILLKITRGAGMSAPRRVGNRGRRAPDRNLTCCYKTDRQTDPLVAYHHLCHPS